MNFVVEIKITDLSDSVPKNKIYHWLFVDAKTKKVTRLHFKSMNSNDSFQYRSFDNGSLKFNDSHGEFTFCTEGLRKLNKVQKENIPVDVNNVIRNFVFLHQNPNG